MKPLQIIGCGPGSRDFLTLGALKTASTCDCLLGAAHLLRLFDDYSGPKVIAFPHSRDAIAQVETLRLRHRVLGILVSGDTGLYSLASPLVTHFGKADCQLHPGLSSVQLACARLGIAWENARVLSAHAALPAENSLQLAEKPETLIVLGGTAAAVKWCAELAQTLGSAWHVAACSNLGWESEQIVPHVHFGQEEFPSRTIFVFQKGNT